MKKTSVKLAPFDQRGSLLHWTDKRPGENKLPSDNHWGSTTLWRANDPFTETLTLGGVTSGRSAKYVTWKAEDGRSFPMFVADLVDFVQRLRGSIIDSGTVTARWMVAKRGANYGIRLAKEGE